jgi:ACS family hexuronate transporter-like MFS transporter
MVVPILLANYTHSEWVAIALFSLAAGAHQGWSANIFTTVSDMFPRSEVGSVTGIGGMAGSLGGFLIALFAGHVLQATGSYFMLIVIASGAYLVALAVIVTLAPGLKKAEIYA